MTHPEHISRRDFLKLATCAAASLAVPAGFERGPFANPPLKGRVQASSLIIRESPAFSARRVGSLRRDSLVEITATLFGGQAGDHNRVWHQLGEGQYVTSSWVQPVRADINDFIPDIPASGRLAEITLPYAESAWSLGPPLVAGPRLYYASTHWISGWVASPGDGSPWYRAFDPSNQARYYLRPESVRLLTDQDLEAISTGVPPGQKRIHVYLEQQVLLAYECGELVYSARVSTGGRNTETPIGSFRTFHKRPTYHMSGGASASLAFDLPGVPWDTYITDTGVAMHGTYWHNDFGTPHSHGCINMRPEDARWIYRWTTPTVPPDRYLQLEPGMGTQVCISRY